MNPRKRSGIQQQGATEFLGIVETDSESPNPGNTAGSDGRHGQPNTRKLRRAGERAEDKA
jgi:hypothetical protein